MDELRRLRHPDRRACIPRPARAFSRRRFCFPTRSRPADRAVLFKTAAKEIGSRFGIMPSFMAKWNTPAPRLQRAHAPEPLAASGEKNLFHDEKDPLEMSALFKSYLAGQMHVPARVPAVLRADDQQLQAPGRRLLGADQGDLGRGQPHGRVPRDSRKREIDARRDARARLRRQPLSRDRRVRSPAGCTASKRISSSRTSPSRAALITIRAPRGLPRNLHEATRSGYRRARSRASSLATTSSTISSRPAIGNGGSSRTRSRAGSCSAISRSFE